jgi:3-oxoacyl-[acyl-carrier-protein] synthase III
MRAFSAKTKISGTGSHVPTRVVSNDELAATVDTSASWIYENLGIRERRIVSGTEFTSDLAVEAARHALRDANIDKNDVDLLIVATATPDRKAPSTACLVQEGLGITNQCPAFDLSAVCSGFLYAITVGSQFIDSGKCRNVLVIGADTFSRITDWSRRDCVFFGDGAGAVVLSRIESGDSGFFSSLLHADGRGKDNFTVHPGDSAFTMNGRAVYETGSRVLPETISTLLSDHNLSSTAIDWIIPHQPSIRMLVNMASSLGISFDRVATNMERFANTSGATIPLLLDEVNKAGKLKRDDLVVFAAVGSGWTWGAIVYRWM